MGQGSWKTSKGYKLGLFGQITISIHTPNEIIPHFQ